MLDKSFGLLFYLKKPKNYTIGEMPIYLRITVDGIPSEISIKRSCDPVRWNSSAGRTRGTNESAKTLNNYLGTFESRIFEIKRLMIENGELMTSFSIKQKLSGIENKEKTLNKVFEDYNDNMKSLIGKCFSSATWTKYERTRRFTIEFIKHKYKVNDIHIKQLDYEFVRELEKYYKLNRKCAHNTCMKYISILNTVILHCIANKWIQHNPFALFKITTEETSTVFLNNDELSKIENRDFKNDRLNRIKDVFIFCCYTGLSFADVKKLNNTEILIGVDNELWIFTDRQKTSVQSKIPLLPKAIEILQRYKDDIKCIAENRALPVLTNQKYNAYLKEIADLCGINKNLTTHCARHTFSTTITLANGVPIETVSKMLGHKKISTTQLYAKVIDSKISEDMRNLKTKLI